MKMSKEIRHVDLIDTDSDSSNTTPKSSSETSTSTSETEIEEGNENLEHDDLNQEILHWMADCYRNNLLCELQHIENHPWHFTLQRLRVFQQLCYQQFHGLFQQPPMFQQPTM